MKERKAESGVELIHRYYAEIERGDSSKKKIVKYVEDNYKTLYKEDVAFRSVISLIMSKDDLNLENMIDILAQLSAFTTELERDLIECKTKNL